ncbi:MAG: hypothetical protein GXP49_04650 [Deltaproteobacteria bacterium]|nr:hypothetical protein [Deltaproteobacteria bacterium]
MEILHFNNRQAGIFPKLVLSFGLSLVFGNGCGGQGNDAPDLYDTSCMVQAPLLAYLTPDQVVHFSTPAGRKTLVGYSANPNAKSPSNWAETGYIDLSGLEGEPPFLLKLFARVDDPACLLAPAFEHTYEVVRRFPPSAGNKGTTAVDMHSKAITGWASRVVSYKPGKALDQAWTDTSKAIGPAQGNSDDVLSLGRGGSVVVQFEPPIHDGPGFDLGIFENSFNDTFLELAFVDVSTDGRHFVSFDTAYLGTDPVGPYGSQSAGMIQGLAGKYRQGYATPFDLALLKNKTEVLLGEVDIGEIHYVRLRDVVGDGRTKDSFGNAIYDPFPTKGSAGFDLDAVASMNQLKAMQ